jgi:alpha-ribazole phosphatase
MGKLILIRHGETKTNTKGLIHKVDDPEVLTKKGIEQIKAVANSIKKYNPSVIYSSKEKRAIQSAEIVSKLLKIPNKQIVGMEERNWGEYSGKSFQEIKYLASFDSMTLEERYSYLPPSGESWKSFEERLISSLQKGLRDNNKVLVIITHGGAIRALMPHLLNASKEESFKYDPPNASISIFEIRGSKFTPEIVVDTTHLK